MVTSTTTPSANTSSTSATPTSTSTSTSTSTVPEIGILVAPTLGVTKSNSLGGTPAEPGDDFEYNFVMSCSSIDEDCQDFVFTDVLPAEFDVDLDSLPGSVPGLRTVTYDATTRALSIAFIQPIDNPAGTGWNAGSVFTFDLSVSMPTDTDLVTGDIVSNTAGVTAANGQPASSTSDVTVNIPRIVNPVTTKSWADSSAIAGTGETSTINLGVRNASSTSAEVTSLEVRDASVATFEHVDLTSVTVTQYPAGADTAQLLVCTLPGSVCTDAQYVAGPTTTGSTPALPAGVSAASVTGVRVRFTNSAGEVLPRSDSAGGVVLGTALRDTFRSTGLPLRPTAIIDISNCASTVAVDAVQGAVAGADSCAPYRVIPDTLVLTPVKAFFADSNGNFANDPGEFAVVGANSPVTARVNVTNASPFAIAEIVITEPSTSVGQEFDKLDTERVRLRLPAGATNAELVVTYDSGTPTTANYSANTTVPVARSGARVTSVTVTYTGTTAGGDPSIAANAEAGLDLNGPLNDGVTDDDLPGGTSPGVQNCAGVSGDAGRGDGTGTFAGTACATLQVEPPRGSGTGVKDVSQTTIPEGQPVTFSLRVQNNGNIPIVNPVLSDPPTLPDGTPDPAVPNPFDSLQITAAAVTPTTGLSPIAIEVFVPGTGWVSFAGADLVAARGIRARMTGDLNPLQAFTLSVTVLRRPGIDDDVALTNCFVIRGDGLTPPAPSCSPVLATGEASAGATLIKSIAPGSLPEFVPGLARQNADITLRTRNVGNLSGRSLQVTDDDADFFDAVDFVSFGTFQAPAGANRVRVDAFVGGAWVTGTPTTVNAPVLPAGITAIEVRGLRFTFTSTSTINGGYVIVPCTAATCEGIVRIRVSPRPTLISNPEVSPDGVLSNTVNGAFETRLDPPGSATPIGPSTSGLTLVEGTPRIDVNKGPENTTLAPGEPGVFSLVVTNNGTANIPDLTVVDNLPVGLAFDDTFDGDGEQPFTAAATSLPTGTPPLPAPEFEIVADPALPERVGQLRWTFPGWNLPPNATVTIQFRVVLEPGVRAGQVITNTMGASSPVDGLLCTPPDAVSSDGSFGEGPYCTDPARVTARAGAAFAARKWVAGTPELGWYSPRAGGTIVPVGGGGCPTFNAGGVLYTSNPCVALVDPGDSFQYLLIVRNAGTEPANQMRLIDEFPAPGDTGVLGAPRGTQWNTRPTLAGAPVYTGSGTAEFTYTSGAPCVADLTIGGPGCPAGAWSPGFSSSARAFKLAVTFPTRLLPGQGITIAFSMTAPVDVDQVANPTVAWNSFAHAESTQTGSGGERILPPIEPIKVGVAVAYGTLEVIKEIGDNPAGLPVEDLEYTFSYTCTINDGIEVARGELTVVPGTPERVTGIAAGATCSVVETGTNGGVTSAPPSAPAIVEVGAGTSGAPSISSVTVTNDFPLGTFVVAKAVSGTVLPEFTDGPFVMTVDCTFAGTSLEGFPAEVSLASGESREHGVPVGVTCSVEETADGGAASVTYEPATGVDVVPADGEQTGEVVVTNDFLSGSLVIVKDVIGAGVPAFSSGPFEFEVVCAFNGDAAAYTTTVTIAGSSDGSTVQSSPITGLPIGAECAATETDSAGADFTPLPESAVIVENAQENVVAVSFLDPFSAGTISVEKTVDGSAADSDYVASLTFTIGVDCAVAASDGSLTTLFEGEFDITTGERVTALEDDGNPVLFPVGTRCWGVESSSGGATDVVINATSYETGVEVLPIPEGPQNLTIDVTNTFEAATLEVSKTAVNGPAGEDYSFTITCNISDNNGDVMALPLPDGGLFTLADGEVATFEVLAGASCAVVEVEQVDGAAVTIVDSGGVDDDDLTDGVVTVGETASVAFTNTFDPPAPTTTTDLGGGGGSSVPPTTTDPVAPEQTLPATGTAVASTAILASVLIGLGVLLAVRRRRAS